MAERDLPERVRVSLRLRPLRLAFLIDKYNNRQIRQAIQLSTCLWGGLYNPIIPVYQKKPSIWQEHEFDRQTVQEILRAYLDTFEPDFVVQMTPGLADGLEVPKERVLEPADCYQRGDEDPIQVGVGVYHLYKHLYRTEFRFERRHEISVILPAIPATREGMFFAACFGQFPDDDCGRQMCQNFSSAFEPEEGAIAIGNLLSDLSGRSQTPLSMGSWGIRVIRRSAIDDLVLLLMDASSAVDIIDFWNMRAFGVTVLPVPIQYADSLLNDCSRAIARNYVPYRHNPSMMHHTELRASRSISSKEPAQFAARLELPARDSIVLGAHRRFDTTPLRYICTPQRCELAASEDQVEANDTGEWIAFRSLSPAFAESMSLMSRSARWANVVRFGGGIGQPDVASVLPLGPSRLVEARLPGGDVTADATTEGLVLCSNYIERSHHLQRPTGLQVVRGWLANYGLECELSSAGKIAYQLIRALGEPSWAGPLANEGLLKMFERMSHGKSEHRDTLIQQLKRTGLGGLDIAEQTLKMFTDIGALKIGMELPCPHCGQHPWYDLDSLAYRLQCTHCLQDFDFPSHSPRDAKWRYRVSGPFAIQGYAQGAYGVVLALRTLGELCHAHTVGMTWTPGINLHRGRESIGEIDLIALCEGIGSVRCGRGPLAVFGECKSGKESFEGRDVARMCQLGRLFPGSILAFFTFKQGLDRAEVEQIKRLAKQGRHRLVGDMWRHPVLILTGTELFDPFGPPECWKGPKYPAFLNNRLTFHDVYELCDITQQIHLGLEPFQEWQEKRFAQLAAGRRKRIPDGCRPDEPPAAGS